MIVMGIEWYDVSYSNMIFWWNKVFVNLSILLNVVLFFYIIECLECVLLEREFCRFKI